MRVKKTISILYTASILLGSFCPMSMAAAMQPSQLTENVPQLQEAFMSPYVPMTPAAPMSVGAVVTHYASSPMTQAPGGCPAGNCMMMDHTQKQEIAISTVSGGVQGGAALPAIAPLIIDSLSLPPSPRLYLGDSHFAHTIGTIVLRV